MMVPGVSTARVPTAGEESVHMAPCTPGVATETCCLVPLTMVEQPVRRIAITPRRAATPRPMAQPPQVAASRFGSTIYGTQLKGESSLRFCNNVVFLDFGMKHDGGALVLFSGGQD